MNQKQAQTREALIAAREEIQSMRRRLEIAEARLSTLDALMHITGARCVSGGAGWPNVLKMIEEALEPEMEPAPQRVSGGAGASL